MNTDLVFLKRDESATFALERVVDVIYVTVSDVSLKLLREVRLLSALCTFELRQVFHRRPET